MGHVSVTRSDHLNVLRIARPEKKNALSLAMYKALSDGLSAGEADPDLAVHVILGGPGIFSAGNDIHDFIAVAAAPDGAAEILRFISLLPTLEKPLLAAIDGPAVGIGTTLLLHCDLVYASPRAELSTPFTDLGLVPEAASSLLMPARIGYQRAFEMLVLGATFSAERAREAGLVNAVVDAEALEPLVLEAASRLARKPPAALAAARRLMRGASKGEIRARMAEEAELFRKLIAAPEAREAFQAFLDKRPADVKRPQDPARTGGAP